MAKINSFAPRSEQLTEQLVALRASQSKLSSALAVSDDRLRSHEHQLSRCDALVAATALKIGKLERIVDGSVVKTLTDQSERLQHAEDAIESLAIKSSSSEAAQRTLSAKFHSVASALVEQVKTQGDTFQVPSDRLC